MGEVYRARDERLKRDVAIKVLPAELAGRSGAPRARFEREARAASALSHPNILTIYDIGTHDSTVYIAMELVDGGTLKDLVASGPVPVKKLLEITVQIADGLAAAHAAGIVHRDLKPQNVMVSKHGFAKILDFGLAKLVTPVDQEVSALKTAMEGPDTRPAWSWARSDTCPRNRRPAGRWIFVPISSPSVRFSTSLRQASVPSSALRSAETLTAIIREEPVPVAQLNPRVPAPIRWLVERCLSKDPEDRFGTTKDLARDLADVRDRTSPRLPSILDDGQPVAAAAAAVRAGSAEVAVAPRGALVLARRRRASPRTWPAGKSGVTSPPTFQRADLSARPDLHSARFTPDGQTISLLAATWEGRPVARSS